MKVKQKPLSFSLHPDNHAYIEGVVAKEKLNNHRYNRSMYMDDLITHLRTKAKPKAKAKAKTELVFIDNLNVQAWDKWIEYRKKAKIKAYTTDLKKKELATMGTYDEQAQIVFNSISNQYSGLFALKKDNSAKSENILQASSDSNWHLKEDTGF